MTTSISGFAFPFQIDPTTGSVMTSSDADKLRANIVQILLTNVGERVMRRAYGGGMRQLVNDPDNSVLQAVVQHQVAKSIGLLEPRVMIQSLTTSQSDDGSTLYVSLQYVIRNTMQPQSLNVPIGLGGT